MTVAVTGATGFVGCALREEAARRGVTLRALTRREQPETPGIEWVPGDLHDHAALAKLVEGTEAVIHVAGVVNTPDPMGFHLGNVEGTGALIAAARAVGARRFLFVSSLAAREPQLSKYGESKHHAEALVAASGLDWTVVRPPAIYGPRDREIFEMFRAARWGVLPMPAGRASVIHVDDLARLLLALLPGGPAVKHRVFEPDDGRPGGWSHADRAGELGVAVGRKVFVPQLSKGLLTGAARLDRLVRGDKARLTLDRVGYMAHPDWVSAPEHAVPPEFWTPWIETREGLKAAAQWYREAGWL